MTDDGTGPSLTRRRALALGGATVGGLALGDAVLAQTDDGDETDDETDDGVDEGEDGEARAYRVTVANLTPGQPFTPPAVALHQPSVEVFSVGEPANEPTQELAENGNLDPLLGLIEQTDAIRAAAVGEGPLVPKDDPGDTGNPYYTTVELSADASATHLTVVSMLIATNDGIVGVDTVELPTEVNESKTLYANGYDVGTEENTELYADLVPPAKTLISGGEPEGTTESNPELAEDDVIRPHPGIEGSGDLDASIYDWDEPAGLVHVERIDAVEEEVTETPEEETATAEEGTPEEVTPDEATEAPEEETETPGVETDTPGVETETPGIETETPGAETETADEGAFPGETGTPTDETPPGAVLGNESNTST
ncbi:MULTISPECIES: spondin domain-containing protein [Salinibaculum]|uniref:spondin domain-containing protein n=1 Tax=Salinibaculum TaxID=2732368 RepID=UPI0030D1F0B5